MSAVRRWGGVAVAMLLASLLTYFITPREKLAEKLGPLTLGQMLPERFGDWSVDERSAGFVVNPQQQEVLARIYSQTLSRTYVNAKTGAVVMMAVAYGEDQRDSMQMHFPEICYPAQGFQIGQQLQETVPLGGTALHVKHLVASMGPARIEPITYWIMIGLHPTESGWHKKLTEMRYGLQGFIPDGLLFRVSSIGPDSAIQYRVHEQFLADLFHVLPALARTRLFGAAATQSQRIL
jgi:EpsI family protein